MDCKRANVCSIQRLQEHLRGSCESLVNECLHLDSLIYDYAVKSGCFCDK